MRPEDNRAWSIRTRADFWNVTPAMLEAKDAISELGGDALEAATVPWHSLVGAVVALEEAVAAAKEWERGSGDAYLVAEAVVESAGHVAVTAAGLARRVSELRTPGCFHAALLGVVTAATTVQREAVLAAEGDVPEDLLWKGILAMDGFTSTEACTEFLSDLGLERSAATFGKLCENVVEDLTGMSEGELAGCAAARWRAEAGADEAPTAEGMTEAVWEEMQEAGVFPVILAMNIQNDVMAEFAEVAGGRPQNEGGLAQDHLARMVGNCLKGYLHDVVAADVAREAVKEAWVR